MFEREFFFEFQQSKMSTYRDILKWGNKQEEKLDSGTLQVIQEEFGWSQQRMQEKHLLGNEKVVLQQACQLSTKELSTLSSIVGEANLEKTDFSRASHAYGKYYTDLLLLRQGKIPSPPDAVVFPENENQIEEIIQFCKQNKIAITPFGGASSVTRGVETTKGGISLDLTRHFTKILHHNTTNQTVRVQAGMFGPALEKELNTKGYSCGHFPQSFEYSTVGGWVAARGAGQASTGYGKIEDMVLAMRVLTPEGNIETKAYPKMAQAWNLNEMFTGSEGALGVITEVTLKTVKYRPENRSYASFIFRDFETATTAMRQMIQAEYGKPHLFRLSDPKETDVAFRMKGFNNSISDKVLHTLGYRAGKRCLMFVAVEGEQDFTRFLKRKLKSTAKQNGGFYIGGKPTKKWLQQRFHSAYLREPLMDMGVITDTLETAVGWEQLIPLWTNVQAYMNNRPNTVVMTHLSHIYESGANLYFTFLSPTKAGDEMNDYSKFHQGIVQTIIENGGSLSHHHGVGRTLAPWLNEQYNKSTLATLQRIKTTLDPTGIMNPGVLGLY